LNLANWLTVLRIALVPLIITLLTIPGIIPNQPIFNFGIFSLIFITDFLDGYIARKQNTVTDLGKFLDPLADKILVISILLLFVEKQLIPFYLVAIILFREFAVQGLRLIAASKQTIIQADIFGKAKTVWQYITLSWMILGFPYYMWLVYVMVGITLFSGLNYFIVNRIVFKDTGGSLNG